MLKKTTMKLIKILGLFIFMMAMVQVTTAQESSEAHLNNGRPAGSTPSPIIQQQNQSLESTSSETFNGSSDQDIPGALLRADDEQRDLVFPQDYVVLEDELLNSARMSEILAQFNALKEMVMELREANENLRLENRNIRKSLGSCCTANELGLSASDAYLMQNTPNPLTENTQVEYYIPEGLTNAQIELRDIKGVLVETFNISNDGFGKLDINRPNIVAGTYLYYLVIDSEVIDSKVMIIK